MRKYYVFTLLFFFVLSFCACEKRIANRNSSGKTIVCFGDSLTKGVGAEKGKDYPSVLGEKISLPVINSGLKGDTTRDALKRIERDVLAHDPKLVIVILGGNDILNKIPREETFRNIEEIIERIQSQGAMVVLGTVKLSFIFDPYTKIFRRIAQKYKVLMLRDPLKGVMDNPALKADRIHPNAKGYSLIAENIYKQVNPLIVD